VQFKGSTATKSLRATVLESCSFPRYQINVSSLARVLSETRRRRDFWQERLIKI